MLHRGGGGDDVDSGETAVLSDSTSSNTCSKSSWT